MKTIRTKVYSFSELSQEGKERAIEWYRNTDTFDYSFEWDYIKDDAKEIGLNITELSDHRTNKGYFAESATDCANKIIANHGEGCDTYKTAESFLSNWAELDNVLENNEYESDLKADDMETDFLHDILENYRIMYNKNIDYQNSDEYITETIQANDYQFTKDGNIFNY